MDIVNLGDRIDQHTGAFVETAAVLKNLDLVVAPDTAVAHVAGALGVPLWIALSNVPFWPWQLDREDTPWYPSARLFRLQDIDLFRQLVKPGQTIVEAGANETEEHHP